MARARIVHALAWLSLAALISVSAYHALGALLDVRLAINFPFEIAYGEGIVWQQAFLMPGPGAYSTDDSLPFIVFHYPPVYHLVVHLMTYLVPDYLMSGRFITALSGLSLSVVAGALVWKGAGHRPAAAASSLAAALLIWCIPNLRASTVLMRVDLLAHVLSFAGLLAACSVRSNLLGAISALGLCAVAVFTKQTEIFSGAAVAVLLIRRDPRIGMIAIVAVGVAALVIALWIQWLTGGGFFRHIIGYNVNRFDWWIGLQRMRGELPNLPFAIVAMVSAVSVALRRTTAFGSVAVCDGVLLILAFNLVNLLAMAKSGASYNYLDDLYIGGTILTGIAIANAFTGPAQALRPGLISTSVLWAWVGLFPFQRMPSFIATQSPATQSALVQEIATAPGPVATDDIVLVLRAGRALIYEPAIVAELALTGQWNETPLENMIKSRGFAFAITEHERFDDDRRSPRIAAAFAAAYPRAEQRTRRHWVHYPPATP